MNWHLARKVVAIVLALVAAMDVVAIVLLMSGAQRVVRLAGRPLHVQDIPGAAELGAALCAVLVAVCWRSRPLRATAAAGLAVIPVLGLIAVARRAPAAFPIGDIALIEIYTRLASQANVLLGPYSQYGWHHPGPLYFWLASPFYVLANHNISGIHVAIFVINIASIALVGWTVVRFASVSLALSVMVAVTAYAWRAREILLSAWNAHVPIIPAMALAALCAAIADGQLRLLPLAAAIGTFIVQTHIALLPYTVAICTVAILAGVLGPRHAAPQRLADAGARRIFNATMWLLAVLWIGPIAEELTRSPGNLTRVFRFFLLETHTHPPFAQAYRAWAETMAAMFQPTFRFTGADAFLPTARSWPVVFVIVQLPFLIAISIWAARKQRRFDAWFSIIIVVASMIALWSVTRIVGDIFEYAIVWISVIGLLGSAAIAGAVVSLIREVFVSGSSLSRMTAGPICAGLVIVSGAIAWSRFGDGRRASRVELADAPRVSRLLEGIRRHMDGIGAHKPLLRMGPYTWDIAAGVGLQLQRAGVPFAVEDGAVLQFTDAFSVHGDEDVEITFATSSEQQRLALRPGDVIIASVPPVYADAIPLTPNRNH
jgi:hypothetical protein